MPPIDCSGKPPSQNPETKGETMSIQIRIHAPHVNSSSPWLTFPAEVVMRGVGIPTISENPMRICDLVVGLTAGYGVVLMACDHDSQMLLHPAMGTPVKVTYENGNLYYMRKANGGEAAPADPEPWRTSTESRVTAAEKEIAEVRADLAAVGEFVMRLADGMLPANPDTIKGLFQRLVTSAEQFDSLAMRVIDLEKGKPAPTTDDRYQDMASQVHSLTVRVAEAESSFLTAAGIAERVRIGQDEVEGYSDYCHDQDLDPNDMGNLPDYIRYAVSEGVKRTTESNAALFIGGLAKVQQQIDQLRNSPRQSDGPIGHPEGRAPYDPGF
jgi:hypothetical protein